MGINKKIIISLLTLTVLYGGYYFGIPAVLNTPKSVNFLKSYIKKEFGFDTKIQNPKIKMGYLPSVWIKADTFAILNNDGSAALEFGEIHTKIKLLPLVFSKAEISSFSGKNLIVNLTFDKNSCLKLGQYPIVGISQPKIKLNPKTWYGITAYQEMIAGNFNNALQPEWPGFYPVRFYKQ